MQPISSSKCFLIICCGQQLYAESTLILRFEWSMVWDWAWDWNNILLISFLRSIHEVCILHLPIWATLKFHIYGVSSLPINNVIGILNLLLEACIKYYVGGEVHICAALFVEHLQNLKKNIINLQRKKIKLCFHIWFLFVTQGVKFKHFG